jgi:predicted metalloprotease with PDZ domain
MIHFRIDVADVATHRYRVTMTVPAPAAETVVSLPVWIPGSYMVREFGRHLSRLQARQGKQERAGAAGQDQLAPALRGAGRPGAELRGLCLRHLGAHRLPGRQPRLLQPTSLCLRVHGREAAPAGADRQPAQGLGRGHRHAGRGGRHTSTSADYDELVDHPFELGTFWRGQFEAGGVPHEFVVAGAWPGFDGKRLLADTQRICAAQIAFWHGRRKPPFGRYVFMLNAVEDGYGGLEHRASTALIAKRADLPRQGMASRCPRAT